MIATRKPFGQYIREFVAWLHNQPFTKPILSLLYSRKAMIASALTALILQLVPQLEPHIGEVGVIAAELVSIGFIWLFTSLGYVIEDAAAKKSGLVG